MLVVVAQRQLMVCYRLCLVQRKLRIHAHKIVLSPLRQFSEDNEELGLGVQVANVHC